MAAETVVQLSSKRWSGMRNLLERAGPFCKKDFTPSSEILEFLQKNCKVLVIGAGGLGCELLKDLALMGFGEIHVIDMDIIDLSNLNRQFLFRSTDIGSSKAECAARFINERIPTCRVTPHFCKIQDKDEEFYQQFHMVICGLDSIVARRWINGMLLSMTNMLDDNSVDMNSLIPMVDGGTEGFKGNARIIVPKVTACIDCTLNLFPPQVNFPLCTIANTPRLPEHCIEYVKVIQWEKEDPFNATLDGDDPQHLTWVYERALERANQFNISGVTYRLVQGVIKHIIPAVASTNAVIAAACATEAFKLATNCYDNMSNYMTFSDDRGIYTYTYEAEKQADCLACGATVQKIDIKDPNTTTLDDLIKILVESPRFQMKSPCLITNINGKRKTLYLSTVPSIEKATRVNLTKSLSELELCDGQMIHVVGLTSPLTVNVQLKYKRSDMEIH